MRGAIQEAGGNTMREYRVGERVVLLCDVDRKMLVDATRLAIGCPLIFIGAVKTPETNATTSGRPDASRWSSTSHWDQVEPS